MKENNDLGRRTFLGGSLAGAAAALSPDVADAQTPGSGMGGGGGGGRRRHGGFAGTDPRDKPSVTPINPAQANETWVEPWVWRPSDWPGQQLELNVVENENPGPVVGFGNPSAILFSYGGNTPGPTIRMSGDETLAVRLRNMLGEDLGKTVVGPNPDPNAVPIGVNPPVTPRSDFCLGEHTNGVHAAHVTNLHTHGLHVRPGRNPDGTHSDNVIFRLMPQADLKRREQEAKSPECAFLRDKEQINFLNDDEQAGYADYEFRLGDVEGDENQPHPPGTHWYHPHAHGATHEQVSSGMAGYLIVEGDIDESINKWLTGETKPDPTRKTGPYDYRERLVFIQRVSRGNRSRDPDSLNPALRNPPSPAINGDRQPATMTMRPGAFERWRVLNGSVDGRGFKRIMVLKGQYVYIEDPNPSKPCQAAGIAAKRLFKIDPQSGKLTRASRHQVDQDKQPLYQLAMDGVTLVRQGRGGRPYYWIKDLAEQNPKGKNPLANPDKLADNPNEDALMKYQNVFKDGTSIKDCWVQPNEVFMGPANRTDILFQAPPEADQVYTVFAQAVVVHADTYQLQLQQAVAAGNRCMIQGPEDIVVAYVAVQGDPVPGKKERGRPADVVKQLRAALPPVPRYLTPIPDSSLKVGAKEASAQSNRVKTSQYRTRTIKYSGWGAADFPLIEVPTEFVAANPNLKDIIYSAVDGVNILLPAAIRTMAIDGKKFNPNDPRLPRMLLNSREEWAVYNESSTLWGETGSKPKGQYGAHYNGLPLKRKDGQDRFENQHAFQLVTRGVDHPFHIHQNPFWLSRIDIPDENGNLHNILDEPRWQDTQWIPRNAGRILFRTLFPDFVGAYVNHCHLLLHEDNGMMQVVEVTPFEDKPNYVAKNRVSSPGDSGQQISRIYPRPSLDESYLANVVFDDPNPTTGQKYPGFPVKLPTEA